MGRANLAGKSEGGTSESSGSKGEEAQTNERVVATSMAEETTGTSAEETLGTAMTEVTGTSARGTLGTVTT